MDHITIKYTETSLHPGVTPPGFYAARDKMRITPFFKKIEEVLYCFPHAEISKEAAIAGSWMLTLNNHRSKK